jgi:hypothetical protein
MTQSYRPEHPAHSTVCVEQKTMSKSAALLRRTYKTTKGRGSG